MAIRSLEELYANYPADNPDGAVAREAIVQSDWLCNSVEFDPVSGDALPQSLSHFLTRLSLPRKDNGTLHDRLWRIVDYSADAFVRIIRSLNEQPRTDHARMHVSRVREMDASSFVKLANRTGRTVREKLGNDPFVTSVRHYQSVDILENQLLKAFALRMEELLESRARAFDEPDSDLLVDIRNWLVSDEAKSISRWKNLPPNNALLSHRDYRRIWKAWRWLQSLDDDVKYDAEHVIEHRQIISFWERLAQSFTKGNVIADIPIDFDYDIFYIGTKATDGVVYAKNAPCHQIEIGNSSQIPVGTNAKTKVGRSATDAPVCIDLTSLKPLWTSGRTLKRLDALLVWQQWSIDGTGSVPLVLEDAGCVWTSENASTVTIRDLMLPGRVDNDVCERAASDFLEILKERFQSPEMVWLVPDCVNEFELLVLRRHINNRYELAQPLPRSVATVVEKVDGRRIRDGYSVTVLDVLGGRVYATKLVARKCADPALVKRVPQSFGYYWERQPTVVFTDREWTLKERLSGVNVLNEDLQWEAAHKDVCAESPLKLKKQYLESDERFAGSEIVFTDVDPVVGGLLMYEWQKSAGDIPLWRDHLPDLDLSASTGKEMLRVHLVSNTTIVPRTGLTFDIPVEATFTLPAGHDVYTFPLYQGAGVARLRYQAKLSSREAFPLKEALPCKLVMRYRYGADNPYELRFQPRIDMPCIPQSFLVEWVPVTAEMFEANAPVPGFPVPLDWATMSSFGKRQVDMVARLRMGLDRLLQYAAFLASTPTTRRFVQLRHFLDWREGNFGGYYAFLRIGHTDVYVHSDDFEEFQRDATEISFDIETDNRGRSRARNITIGETIPSKFTWIRYLLRSPMAVVFGVLRDRNGIESLGDVYPLLEQAVVAAESFYEMDGVDPETKYELLCSMAYYNSRIPQSGVNYLNQAVEGSGYNAWQMFTACRKAIALAIGDCSENWQMHLMRQVISKLRVNEKWASVVYEILSQALWRSQSLIHKFDRASLSEILDGLGIAIKKDRVWVEGLAAQPNRTKEDHRLDAALNTLCKHLELLLALLRTRESTDPAIRRIIMPGTTNAVNFEAIVGDEVIPLFKKGLWFESHIRLDLEKPEMFRESPDLLYALKLYLTGDDGANSIIVSGISEED